jgi:uncharacterized protein YidB (DUF937 family)
VFEKIDLPPNSAWCLGADRETWLLVLSGGARAGSFDVTGGDAVFVQSDRVNIHAGTNGMVGLVARAAARLRHLLQRLKQSGRNGCRTATGGAGANFTHSKQSGPNERTSGNN